METMAKDRYELLTVQVRAVQKEFPHCGFRWEAVQDAHFDWEVSTQRQNGAYLMRLYINPAFPEICPAMYVWAPVTLWRASGGTVNEVGSSHSFHTLENGPGGRVRLCHSSPADWDASVSYVLPILRSFLWCEAYEAHLHDGNSIAHYLK